MIPARHPSGPMTWGRVTPENGKSPGNAAARPGQAGQRRGVSGTAAPSPSAQPRPARPPEQPPWLVYFGVIACFFLSGLAALLYQTAWLRQFSLVFGTSELGRRHGAGRLHGRAGAGLGGCRALRRARHPPGAGVRPARGRDRPVRAGGAADAACVPRALYAAMLGGQPAPPDAAAIGQPSSICWWRSWCWPCPRASWAPRCRC